MHRKKQVKATQLGDDLDRLRSDDRIQMPGKSHTQVSCAGSDDFGNVTELTVWCVSEHVCVRMSLTLSASIEIV